MKLGIVGFGASAIGLLESIKNNNIIEEIHIFERSKDIYSSSLSGIRSDGKLFVSENMGGDLEISKEIQFKAVNYYLKHFGVNIDNDSIIRCDKITTGDSFKNKNLYSKFYHLGFDPIESKFFHIGTDELANVIRLIFEQLQLEFKNKIYFHFNQKIIDIDILDDNNVILKSENDIFKMNKAYVCAGRSGHKLINSIINKYPNLVLSNTMVDLGVRFELPNHIVEELNKEMYEFKVKYKTKTGYTARTFCNNPSGIVVLEDYDDFASVNGHSNSSRKTDNTNFAILVSHSFTYPFNHPTEYGSYIAKLSNILAGGGKKVLLQCYGDFKKGNRTKKLGRVKPTLENNNFVLGDLNLVFPAKTVNSIIDFMENLNIIIPGITYDDNLLYGVEVKFYGYKLDNNCFNSLKFLGDCSGWTRSITYATGHGMMEGQKNNFEGG